MKKTNSIIPDKAFTNKGYGYIINGALHIARALYDYIYHNGDAGYNLLKNLIVVDVDELIYIENLDEMKIFTGQQVHVSNNGFYVGDAAVTCFPYAMQFDQAEVTMYFPDKGKVIICPVTSLVPIVPALH